MIQYLGHLFLTFEKKPCGYEKKKLIERVFNATVLDLELPGWLDGAGLHSASTRCTPGVLRGRGALFFFLSSYFYPGWHPYGQAG